MRGLTLRSAAIAALVLSPAMALAQGGPGGGGPGDDGARGGGAHQGEMRRDGGGERQDRMKGAEQRRDRDGGADRGHDQGMRHGPEDRRMGGDERRDPGDRDRGEMHGDRDRGEMRGDRDRGEMRGDRDRGEMRGDKDVRIERDRVGGERRFGRLRPEVRDRFRTSVRGLGGERVRGADFDVGVGRVVPNRYHFNRLPPSLVEIAPEYRDFDYLLVGDSILIIDPVTREIVDVLS